MPSPVQESTIRLVARILSAKTMATPTWLLRPAEDECGGRWESVRAIYRELTGLDLPDAMPRRETRRVDAVLDTGDGSPRILEVDGPQHFNTHRALTLLHHPPDVRVAFPAALWVARSEEKRQTEGVGFGTPRPPLFPTEGGRHMQRAFRDMLADVIPAEHGYQPTLRIANFEVASWIFTTDAEAKMRELLAQRFRGVSARATGTRPDGP